MHFIVWTIVFLGSATFLAYHRSSLRISTIFIATLMLAYTAISASSLEWKLLMWVLFSAVAIPLNFGSIRVNFISRRLLAVFRKVLPEMSETERTALAAGTVWWDGQLFSGRPDWIKLLSYPRPTLSAEERAFLEGPVAEFCGMLDEWKITHEDADFTPEAWQFLKDKGFFGMIIPKSYGGLGFSAIAHSEVLAKISSAPAGATAGSTVAVPNSLGPAELLLHYGTEEQKNHYLPRLAKGVEIPCFALTSPYAGSDAGAIPDKGVVCKGIWKGKEILGMKLTWDKRYITLAPIATVLGLAFKLYDPEHLLGSQENIGVTCGLIPTDTPGVKIGRRHFPLNSPFMNGPTQGKDVFVPLDYIIGGPKMAGQGWRMLMECLAVGRSISLPSMTMGGANAAAFATGAYARIRRQFNVHIGAFEGVQEALARIGGRCYAGDAVRMMTAGAVDLGEKPSVPSAIAKYHCTHMAQQCAIDAMDVHGGKGVMLGPSNYLGRAYQGAPIAITVEGANILTRSMIIFGQGAIRCHPYVLKEMEAARDTDQARGVINFDAALWAHIGHVISNKARSIVLGLTNGRLAGAPAEGIVRRYYQRLSRYSANLALMADVCMAVLGGSLKFRESISARLGDVLAKLYIASATLKRFEEDGRPGADLPLLSWVMEDSMLHIEQQLDGVLRNLPSRPVAWLLRLVIFPSGMRARPPSDKVNTAIAEILQTPCASRDRLARTVNVPEGTRQPLGLLNVTMQKIIASKGIEKRVLEAFKGGRIRSDHPAERIEQALAAGVVNADEARQLREAFQLLHDVISVDDFDHSELARTATASKIGARETAAA